MGRQRRFKNPVRFSIQLEKELADELDQVALNLGVERNVLIARLLTKHAHDVAPFSLSSEDHDRTNALIAAEPPPKYQAKPARTEAS